MHSMRTHRFSQKWKLFAMTCLTLSLLFPGRSPTADGRKGGGFTQRRRDSSSSTLTELMDSLKTLLWKPWDKLIAALNRTPSRTSNGR